MPMLTVNMPLDSEVLWALLFTYLITSAIADAAYSPKSEVEEVPGLILPRVLGRICMLRVKYVCRWTYESSCGCRLLRKGLKRRTLEISLVEQKKGKNEDAPEMHGETHGCLTKKDRCIKMS